MKTNTGDNMKGKFVFFRNGQYLGFYIIKMDERFRICYPNIKEYNEYRASNRVFIMSGNNPELDVEKNRLWLIGNSREQDCQIDFRCCKDITEAESVKNNYILALIDWASNWQEWKDDKHIKPIINHYGNITIVEV